MTEHEEGPRRTPPDADRTSELTLRAAAISVLALAVGYAVRGPLLRLAEGRPEEGGIPLLDELLRWYAASMARPYVLALGLAVLAPIMYAGVALRTDGGSDTGEG